MLSALHLLQKTSRLKSVTLAGSHKKVSTAPAMTALILIWIIVRYDCTAPSAYEDRGPKRKPNLEFSFNFCFGWSNHTAASTEGKWRVTSPLTSSEKPCIYYNITLPPEHKVWHVFSTSLSHSLSPPHTRLHVSIRNGNELIDSISKGSTKPKTGKNETSVQPWKTG